MPSGTLCDLTARPDGWSWSAENGRRLHGHDGRVSDRLDMLFKHCADLGIEVEWSDLGETRRGQYEWRRDLITLNNRMTMPQLVSTFAHEFAHAIFGDRCTVPAQERRAWEYAAAFLVTPTEYAAAEELVGSHPNALAAHLGVTARLIEAWRRWWETKGRLLPANRHLHSLADG